MSVAACSHSLHALPVVRIRKGGMQAKDVAVLDMSLAGCMVAWKGWTLKLEERVVISFPNLANLPATVLWSEDQKASFLFNNPLHEAVYDHLIRAAQR